MTKKKRKTPIPIEDWPLWKLVGLILISSGLLAIMLTFIPYYHPIAFVIGIILLVTGVISFIYTIRKKNWWAGVVFQNTWPLLIFAMGARALISQLPIGWIWITLLLACYILAWLVPVLDPKLSALLWREQTAPETRLGKGCMVFVMKFSPTIMALGPISGIYLSRHGYDNIFFLVFGTMNCLIAIVLGQLISHQIWPKRPWAQPEEPETDGH